MSERDERGNPDPVQTGADGGDGHFTALPVGYVRSPFRNPADAPHQGREAGVEVVVEIDPRYAEALEGVEKWECLIVVCWLHLSARRPLKIHPRGRADNPERGVFSTRSPVRPNPLALYTAELLGIEGTTLRLRGIDAVDGTPVIDIRPHVHRLDDCTGDRRDS